jgi:hypothetical protein
MLKMSVLSLGMTFRTLKRVARSLRSKILTAKKVVLSLRVDILRLKFGDKRLGSPL